MSETLEAPIVETVAESANTELQERVNSFFGRTTEVSQQQEQVNQEQVAETPIVTQPDLPTIDWSKELSERTGGKLKSWEELEAISQRQPEVIAPSFSNETSRQLYEAILNGEEDKIEDYYVRRNQVKTLNTKPIEAVVKAKIKDEYKDFTELETDYLFEKEFGLNEDDYDGDEIGLSVAKKVRDSKLNEAHKNALKYFELQAQEVQLPKFEKAQDTQVQGVDMNTETAKKVAAFVESQSVDSYSGNEIPFKYINQESGANVEGKITFDEKTLSEFVENLGDHPDIVFVKKYLKPNGDFDNKKFATDQYLLATYQKNLAIATSEGYNKGRLQKMMQDRNIPIYQQDNSAEAPVLSDKMQEAQQLRRQNWPLEAILKITGIDLR